MSGATDLADSDREAILAAATDYIESWLDGDSERMARCLHPELVKRAVVHLESEPGPTLDTMTRDDMVTETGQGHGRALARPYDVGILDAFGEIATVRVLSSAYVDYLHVAKVADGWQLVNVLWRRRPADADE